MTKREKWIAEFKIRKNGAEAIEELKELEDHRGRDGIEELRDKILEACFFATDYERSRDFYEISRVMDKESLKIKPLLECIKQNEAVAWIKAENFLLLLAKKGISIHIKKKDEDAEDTGIITFENDLPKILEIIVESIYESESSRYGDSCSVVGNIDYSKDLTGKNQPVDVSLMGLIFELRLIIEKWLVSKGVYEGDSLSRQSDNDSKRFLHYEIITLFVNATLDKSYTAKEIKNKLKKHLDSNPKTRYGRRMIFD